MKVINCLATESRGRAVAILDSGEYIRISVIGHFCFVKNSRFGWLGKELYSEQGFRNDSMALKFSETTNLDLNIRMGVPVTENFVLTHFLAAAATCKTAAEFQHLLQKTYAKVLEDEH